MTDDIPEQPVVGRLEYDGIELGSVTINLETGEIVEPVGAAADDSRKASSADKTAFECSALVLLHARWLEEAASCENAMDGQYPIDLEIAERVNALRECAAQLKATWAGMKENPQAERRWTLQRMVRRRPFLCWLGLHDIRTAHRFVPDINAPIVTEFHFKAWCERCGMVKEETCDRFDPVSGQPIDESPNEKLTCSAPSGGASDTEL